MRVEPLHQRTRRGHDHRRLSRRIPETVQEPHPPAHRLNGRTHTLEGQRPPGGEQRHFVFSEHCRYVIGEAHGLVVSGCGDQDRPPRRSLGQARDRQRPSCLVDDEHPVAPGDRGVNAGLRGQQRAQ
ncbi:MAG: hypothetical protein KTV16_07280 [Acidimicrobiia bacterium]|nr:hypothetical protein [Acidimicrobiia bacterium]